MANPRKNKLNIILKIKPNTKKVTLIVIRAIMIAIIAAKIFFNIVSSQIFTNLTILFVFYLYCFIYGKIMNKVTLIFAIFIILSSCRSLQQKEIQTEQVIEQTQEKKQIPISIKHKDIHFLKLKANFDTDFPDFSQKFSADIIVAHYDSLSMTVFGPFGITVGKLYADREKFIFYNTFDNTIIKGKSDSQSFEKATRLNLSFPDFVAILRNEPIGEIISYEIFEQKENKLVFAQKFDNFVDFFLYSSEDKAILQYQRKDLSNEKVFDITCNDFISTNFGQLAKQISVAMPKANGNIVIEIEDVQINNFKVEPFQFNLPRKAKIIEVN